MPSQPQTLAGVVLAGGRSTRFGSDKAAARLGGETLLAIAARRLARACAAVAVSAQPGSEAERIAGDLGLPVLHDRPGPEPGPLRGLSAALAWAGAQGADRLATLPCDLPLAPDDLFERLCSALADGGGAAVARTADGLQPLCAVIGVEHRPSLDALLRSGDHPPVRAWLSAIGAREVLFDEAGAFLNVNRREDLERLGYRHPDGMERP